MLEWLKPCDGHCSEDLRALSRTCYNAGPDMGGYPYDDALKEACDAGFSDAMETAAGLIALANRFYRLSYHPTIADDCWCYLAWRGRQVALIRYQDAEEYGYVDPLNPEGKFPPPDLETIKPA